MNPWIPVTDRLPTVGEWVLVWLFSRQCAITYLLTDWPGCGAVWRSPCVEDSQEQWKTLEHWEVTHWRPLPEGPTT